MSIPQAQFAIGQVVHHRLFDYRGVVVDVHPSFQLSDEWYDRVARTRPPKDQPWYHVLVDGTQQITYVAERNLETDSSGRPVAHPLLSRYFSDFRDGFYQSERVLH